MNYFGFSKEVKFGKNCGGILKTSLEWNDVTKKVSTFFMGLSPELEIALYTLAALLAPNSKFKVKLGGKKFSIRTYFIKLNFIEFNKQNGQCHMGAAYPELPKKSDRS